MANRALNFHLSLLRQAIIEPIAFLRSGEFKALDINAPMGDYTNYNRGITPTRATNLKTAGYNGVRAWIETDVDILVDETTFNTRLAGWVDNWKKARDDFGRVFVAQGGPLSDQIACCNNATTAALYTTRLKAIVSAMKANFTERQICIELFNEPVNTNDVPNFYSSFYPQWFTAIRQVWPQITVAMQPPGGYAQQGGFDVINPANFDGNTIYSFHPYAPGEFTHQGINDQRYFANIPYPLVRADGSYRYGDPGMTKEQSRDKMIADTTARIQADGLPSSTEAQQITRATEFITNGLYEYWQTWERWSDWIPAFIARGVRAKQIMVGEYGIAGLVYNTSAGAKVGLTDIDTMANWDRHIINQVDQYQLGGFVRHQMFGDFPIMNQIDFGAPQDTLIPELATAIFTKDALPEGDNLGITEVPVEPIEPVIGEDNLALVYTQNSGMTREADYSASNLDTIFQDSALTVPVTGANQPVGGMLDMSGNAHHLIQPNNDLRPMYRVANGVGYIEFATNQFLRTTGITAGNFVAAGLTFDDPSDWRTFASLSSTDTKLMITQMSGDRFIRTFHEPDNQWSGNSDAVTLNNYLNGSESGKFVNGVPFAFTAQRTGSIVPDVIKIGSADFTGKMFNFSLATGIPSVNKKAEVTNLFKDLQTIGAPVGPEPEYAAETTALLSRMTVQPNPEVKLLIDQCIKDLVSRGYWDRLDVLVMPGADTQQSCLNWKGNKWNATPQGTVSFTPYRGWLGNGSDFYLDSGFDPIAAMAQGSNFQRDSLSFGGGIQDVNGTVARSRTVMGIYAGTSNAAIDILPDSAAANITGFKIGSAANQVATVSLEPHHWFATRTSATSTAMYVDGTAIKNESTNSLPWFSDGLGTTVKYAGRASLSGGVWSTTRLSYARHSYWFIGGAFNSVEQSEINYIFNSYLAGVGAEAALNRVFTPTMVIS